MAAEGEVPSCLSLGCLGFLFSFGFDFSLVCRWECAYMCVHVCVCAHLCVRALRSEKNTQKVEKIKTEVLRT